MKIPVKYHYGRFPPSDVDWLKIIPHISPAVLLSPLTTQEAVLSSRIEGTQATMGEILEYEAKGAP
jgi:hypothetical protein